MNIFFLIFQFRDKTTCNIYYEKNKMVQLKVKVCP